MSDFPYMRFYVSDYLGDTQHLTTIEHGAYFLLLIALWNAPDNTLPNDDKMLARYARMTNGQWRKVAPVLMPLFEVSGGVLRPGAAKSPVDWSVHPSEWGNLRWPDIRAAVLESRENRCAYCGDRNGPFEIDHIVPKSRGGSNMAENLAVACAPCNRSKWAKTPREWGRA